MNYHRFIVLVLFVVLLSSCVFGATKVGDFDGDGAVAIKDVVYELAWMQTGKSSDVSTIEARAKEIYAEASGSITRLPIDMTDDISGDSIITIDDIVLTLGWIQTSKSSDSSLVEARAKEILSTVGYLSKSPEMEIGSSTVPVTITGIQTD